MRAHQLDVGQHGVLLATNEPICMAWGSRLVNLANVLSEVQHEDEIVPCPMAASLHIVCGYRYSQLKTMIEVDDGFTGQVQTKGNEDHGGTFIMKVRLGMLVDVAAPRRTWGAPTFPLHPCQFDREPVLSLSKTGVCMSVATRARYSLAAVGVSHCAVWLTAYAGAELWAIAMVPAFAWVFYLGAKWSDARFRDFITGLHVEETREHEPASRF
jgi:hypothetical protein